MAFKNPARRGAESMLSAAFKYPIPGRLGTASILSASAKISSPSKCYEMMSIKNIRCVTIRNQF